MFKSRTKSVSRNPKQELARLQAEYDRGRTKEAIEELRAVAADRPKSAALRVKLSEWLAKAGRRESRRRLCRKIYRPRGRGATRKKRSGRGRRYRLSADTGFADLRREHEL